MSGRVNIVPWGDDAMNLAEPMGHASTAVADLCTGHHDGTCTRSPMAKKISYDHMKSLMAIRYLQWP